MAGGPMTTTGEALSLAWQAYQAGRPLQAEAICRQILQGDAGNAAAWAVHAVACDALGRAEDAVASYRQALRRKPDYVEVHCNLGILLARLGRFDEAVASYRQALLYRPDFAPALVNLGAALIQSGQVEEAIDRCRQAIRLQPQLSEAHANLGAALVLLGQLAEAERSFHEALRLQPGNAEAHYGLGSVRFETGRYDAALTCFNEALRLRPDHPEAHSYRALYWLTTGDWAQGWPEYEWRTRCPGYDRRDLAAPRWDGAPLTGRTILLHAEQGLGDTIQFVRYAPLVKGRGGTVLLECQPALLPLLDGCRGVDRLVPRGASLPPFDVQVPLLSLPGIFGTTPQSIPAAVPYLAAAPHLVEHWRRELAAYPEFKVGICWKVNRRSPSERYRSIPLRHFERLARLPGVRLFSLQKGPAAGELGELPAGLSVVDLGRRLDETAGAFMDTAAAIQNLDLVITCDTVIGHLAGALAAPVWEAMSFVPNWRWLLGRDDAGWYPTMRLFRQPALGDWETVFARIAEELRRRLPP
jgi:tetratricopeptide (TPR) repeat protein